MYPHDVDKMRNEQLVWHLTQTNLKMLGSLGFLTIMPDWYFFNASGKCVPGTGGSDIKPVSEGHCLCASQHIQFLSHVFLYSNDIIFCNVEGQP